MRQVFSGPSQLISRFVGFVIQAMGKPNSSSTSITFLPPIRHPITEYCTVVECIKQSQRLAAASNMMYTHITVDAGAAQKFFHVLWNNPTEFQNIIIHLGDFHVMMAIFGTIGKLIGGSGFEEIVYQAGLCTAGSIKGVLSGKHYNRSWMVHECFAEAINRLFSEAFVGDVSQDLQDQFTEEVNGVQVQVAVNSPFCVYREQYNDVKQRCLLGEFGLTPQYWMIYQNAVERQHKLHYSINTNDYNLRLQCWRDSLPYFFSMNKQNYARYGTFYCRQLQHLHETHPGAKEELLAKGLFVCRNDMNIGQSIDGAGEQTYMQRSKTTGINYC